MLLSLWSTKLVMQEDWRRSDSPEVPVQKLSYLKVGKYAK